VSQEEYEKQKARLSNNSKKSRAKRREINPELAKKKAKEKRQRESEQRKAYGKIWRLKNKEKCLSYDRTKKNKYRHHPLDKLKRNSRRRIVAAIHSKGFTKNEKTNQILGCCWQTFKNHIESLFKPGMSWDNYGSWHVDHVYPLSKAANEANLMSLFHYTNTQPLWATENLLKGSKIP